MRKTRLGDVRIRRNEVLIHFRFLHSSQLALVRLPLRGEKRGGTLVHTLYGASPKAREMDRSPNTRPNSTLPPSDVIRFFSDASLACNTSHQQSTPPSASIHAHVPYGLGRGARQPTRRRRMSPLQRTTHSLQYHRCLHNLQRVSGSDGRRPTATPTFLLVLSKHNGRVPHVGCVQHRTKNKNDRCTTSSLPVTVGLAGCVGQSYDTMVVQIEMY